MEKGNGDLADGRQDQAISEANAALDIDPKNTAALDLRGSIYMQRKLWSVAERDYTAANQISPDPAFQYKLGEIQYLQRNFDDARPIFAAIKDDARLGDLSRFKVLACDLFGGHEDIAARDLNFMDTTGKKPSFYFGRAAWLWYHGDNAGANRLLAQATGRFDKQLCDLYHEAFDTVRWFRASVASFTTKDGRRFDQAFVSLEGDGLRTSSPRGWVTLPLNQLPDDLSPFPADIRERIQLQRDAIIPQVVDAAKLTFTAKDGKSYRQVRWNIDDEGLIVLTDEGWQTVAFRELPDNLSSFPADLQASIKSYRAHEESAATGHATVSFTTRQGRKYDSVRAFLGDDGLSILTPDGWKTVPFSELPRDLKPFPAAWQNVIRPRLMAIDTDDGNTTVVSFTTQNGTVYHDVRAALSSDGVMLVTPDGWKTVPFGELPSDLSPFPSAWCPVIQSSLQSVPDETPRGVQVVSFTTRRGKAYDQVRATLDDSGLGVVGPNGWVVVSYDQLPDDLSAFPAAWRATITARAKQVSKGPAEVHPN